MASVFSGEQQLHSGFCFLPVLNPFLESASSLSLKLTVLSSYNIFLKVP